MLLVTTPYEYIISTVLPSSPDSFLYLILAGEEAKDCYRMEQFSRFQWGCGHEPKDIRAGMSLLCSYNDLPLLTLCSGSPDICREHLI